MAEIPTQAELSASLGNIFVFSGQGDGSLSGRLIEVGTGVPMSAHYTCYTALFEMPAGASLPQGVYRVASPGGDAWDVLVTPYRPTPEGNPVMGAVFHCRVRAADPACAA